MYKFLSIFYSHKQQVPHCSTLTTIATQTVTPSNLEEPLLDIKENTSDETVTEKELTLDEIIKKANVLAVDALGLQNDFEKVKSTFKIHSNESEEFTERFKQVSCDLQALAFKVTNLKKQMKDNLTNFHQYVVDHAVSFQDVHKDEITFYAARKKIQKNLTFSKQIPNLQAEILKKLLNQNPNTQCCIVS